MLLYDKINVIDLEATCWATRGDYQREHTEIIEIGICKYVVASGEITDKRSIYIHLIKSEISAYCTQLTGITPERVAAEGMTLAEAAKLLKKDYSSDKRVYAGWGDWDRVMMERTCAERGVDPPFGKTYFNLKALFLMRHKRLKGIGLDQVMAMAGETFEGHHHSGADDAFNTAKLLRSIFT